MGVRAAWLRANGEKWGQDGKAVDKDSLSWKFKMGVTLFCHWIPSRLVHFPFQSPEAESPPHIH